MLGFDHRKLPLDALPDDRGQRPIPPPRACVGLVAEQGKGLAVGQLSEGRKDDVLEVPVSAARLRNALRVGQCVRGMGIVPFHRLERSEPVGRSAAGVCRKARERGVQRDGPQEAVQGKLLRAHEMGPVGRHRRKTRASAES